MERLKIYERSGRRRLCVVSSSAGKWLLAEGTLILTRLFEPGSQTRPMKSVVAGGARKHRQRKGLVMQYAVANRAWLHTFEFLVYIGLP